MHVWDVLFWTLEVIWLLEKPEWGRGGQGGRESKQRGRTSIKILAWALPLSLKLLFVG
jgi:hypothetical protein